MCVTSASDRDLRAEGMTRADIDRSIRAGVLVRARRDVYLPAEVPSDVLRAVQFGGRLDCLSLLSARGIFAHEVTHVHVQFGRGAGRLPARGADVRGHWRTSAAAPRTTHAPLCEALAQSASCQPPRSFIASMDSAWNKGLIGAPDVRDIFQLCRAGSAGWSASWTHLRNLVPRRS